MLPQNFHSVKPSTGKTSQPVSNGVHSNGKAPSTVAGWMMRCAEGGLSVIPINHNSKKTFLQEWKTYAKRIPSIDELQRWEQDYRMKSFAIVCGPVSGNLEMLDFDSAEDAKPQPYMSEQFFNPWWEQCGEDVEAYGIPYWQSGGNGFGLVYRCEVIQGSQKLALAPDASSKQGYATVIETRGGWTDESEAVHAGYFVSPPSLHPSGKPYTLLSGDVFHIPTIPIQLREKFLQVARDLSKYVQPEKQTREYKASRSYGANSVIARYNARHSIVDCLLAQGYTEADHGRMSRPGKEDSKGVAIEEMENISFHWSSNDELHQTTAKGTPLPMDPFNVLWYLECNGDKNQAFEHAKRELGEWVEVSDGDNDRLQIIFEEEAPENQEEVDMGDEPEEENSGNNPLATGQREDGIDLGWVDEYAQAASEEIGSPNGLNRLSGIVVSATALRGKAFLPMSWAKIYPNIYAMIVAASSVFRKSSSSGKVRDTLTLAQLQDLLLSNAGTSEGLMKELARTSSGIIINDEIGPILNSHHTKYLKDLKQDLTRLYDCGYHKKSLSSGAIIVQEPYLNILGSTTVSRFFGSITDTDWNDGFLARFLFWTPGDNEPPNFSHRGYVLDTSEGIRMERRGGDGLSARLRLISDKPKTGFTMSKATLDGWHDWRIAGEKAAYEFGDEIVSSFVSRYNTYALKFAIILNALNGKWGNITTEELRAGMALADYFKQEAFNLSQAHKRQGVSGSKVQKVYTIIQGIVRKGEKATTKKILQRANMKKDELDPCIRKLAKLGAVVEEPSGRGFHYLPTADKLPLRSWEE